MIHDLLEISNCIINGVCIWRFLLGFKLTSDLCFFFRVTRCLAKVGSGRAFDQSPRPVDLVVSYPVYLLVDLF